MRFALRHRVLKQTYKEAAINTKLDRQAAEVDSGGMGFFKRISFLILTTAFLLLTLGEALVYFKPIYFIPCTTGLRVTSPDVLIGVLGALFGLFGTIRLGQQRTIFWGLIHGFIGNILELINLWRGVSNWTYAGGGAQVPACPSSPSLLIADTLSFSLLVVCSWVVSLLVGAFCGQLLSKTIIRNLKKHLPRH